MNEENRNSPNGGLIVGAALVAVGLVTCAVLVTRSWLEVKSYDRVIAMTGSAERVIKSDEVKWRSRITRQVPVAELAGGSAGIAADVEAVRAMLTKRGVKAEDIRVEPVALSTICGTQNYYGKGCPNVENTAYVLEQVMTVESSDVDGVTKAAEETASEAVAKGIIFAGDPMEYYFSKLSDIRVEMLTDATRNARDRAAGIVGETGGELGPVTSVSSGVFQVTAVNSVEVSDYGYYDTSSIEKKVTAVVRASFALGQ